MEGLLNDPAVQGGVAPLAAGLVLAAALSGTRLAGLAVAGGFFAAAYLIGILGFWPLNATRKILLLAIAAPAFGAMADFGLAPRRFMGVLMGILFALGSVWVFWTVLAQKPELEAVALGAGVATFVFWTIAFTLAGSADTIRTGAVGLALGLGVGIGAILGASAVLGLLGIALAAGTGGLLLVAMIRGKSVVGGAILGLSVSAVAALIGGGALLLAKAPWWSLVVLALVPLAAQLPVPDRFPPWLRAVVASSYTLSVAAASCMLAWKFGA